MSPEEAIERRRLTPENVALFLSVVQVLRERGESEEGEIGDTLAGRGEAVEMFYNGREPECVRLYEALEARGVEVKRPTYDTGWALLRRGARYAALVPQELVDAYVEIMQRPVEVASPWGRRALWIAAALLVGIAIWWLLQR